jgi:hypothetical protein
LKAENLRSVSVFGGGRGREVEEAFKEEQAE